MSSTMIGALGAVFSVVLMLGLWVEEAQERGSRVAGDWWSPAALGLLRAEVVVVRGLLILLVTRSASWAAGPGLVVLAGWAGVSRFVRVARPESWLRRRWGWLAAGVVLAGAWLLLVGVFLPVPGPVGERVATAVVVAGVMCVFFLGMRGLAWCAARLGTGALHRGSGDYASGPVQDSGELSTRRSSW